MTDKNDKYKRLFNWTLFISAVTIAIMGLTIMIYSDTIKNYKSNYEYACDSDERKICISEDNKYKEYESDESVIVVEENENYAICDKYENEQGFCLSTELSWVQCNDDDYTARCVKKDEDFISCEDGYEAKCVKEDEEGIITSSGKIYYCDSDEFAFCVEEDE